MPVKENSRARWVRNTREAVVRALAAELGAPMSADALHGNLDIDIWSSIGPLMRSEREISAALRWAADNGYARRLNEDERERYDPRGVCYEITPAGQDWAPERAS